MPEFYVDHLWSFTDLACDLRFYRISGNEKAGQSCFLSVIAPQKKIDDVFDVKY
jgi:hypothetical protein